MANNSKRNSNRAGAVLITVLTVACFAAILLTAVLTFVKRAHTNAFNNYNSEQAYYIASSALGSVHDYFEKQKDLNYPDLVAYANASPTGTEGTITLGDSAIDSVIPGGDCKVNISKVNDGYIKLSVTGYYNGQAETINAYYAVTPGQKPPGINNALYSNGDAGFGKAATSSGSVTMRGDYETTNNSVGTGSIITGKNFLVTTVYKWENDPNGTANSYIVAQDSFFVTNQGSTFVPSIAKKDDNTSLFISIGKALFGSVSLNIGDQNSDHEMDVYCNTAFLGSPAATDYYRHEYYSSGYSGLDAGGEAILKMCGNLYCYKIEDTESHDYNNPQDGDLIFTTDTAGLDLEGDLFVEGDIIIRKNGKGVKIKKLNSDDPDSKGGTLYVSPTTELKSETGGALNDASKIECYAISGDGLTYAKVKEWIDAGVLKFTDITNPTEDNLKDRILTEPINHGTASSRNSKPQTSFDNYENDYPSTDELLADPKNLDVNNAYISAGLTNIEHYRRTHGENDDRKNSRVLDPEIGVAFDYVIDSGNGCYIDNSDCDIGKNNYYNYVLIDMDKIDGNFVVRLKGENINLDYTYFIIKNGVRKSDGSFMTQPDKFCYFIVEDRDGTAGAKISMTKTAIIDYNTFKYVVKDNRALDISATYDQNTGDIADDKTASGGFYHTLADGTRVEFGVYTPNAERIYFLLRENDELYTGEDGVKNDDGYALVMEGIVYGPGNDNGPGAYVHGMGKGMSWEVNKSGNQVKMPLVLKNNSSDEVEVLNKYKDCRLAFIGAVICGSFKDERENFWVSFIPPAPGAGVGDGGSEDVGTVTFSHYESR